VELERKKSHQAEIEVLHNGTATGARGASAVPCSFSMWTELWLTSPQEFLR